MFSKFLHNFNKDWKDFIQTIILIVTFFAATFIGVTQNNINKKLSEIEYTNVQPILGFDHVSVEEAHAGLYKIYNGGNGSALNIRLVGKNPEGKLVTANANYPYTAIAPGRTIQLPKDYVRLAEISFKYIQDNFSPNIYSYLLKKDKEMPVSTWMAIVYEDINGKNYVTIYKITQTDGESKYLPEHMTYKMIAD